MRLQKLSRVEMLGRVDDSGVFMDECAVLALPVFLRGGVPLKLVEAMARGKAIVASQELVAGLELRDGDDLLIRSSAEDFASAIVSLLQDPVRREQLGANARAAFLRDFSLSAVEERLRHQSVLMQHADAAITKDVVAK